MFAPHVGLSDSLELGKYSRIGQHCAGSACGAAIGAFNACMCGDAPLYFNIDPSNYQMDYLISEIKKRKDSIANIEDKNGQQAQLCKDIYEISKEFLEKIVTTDFSVTHENGHLILLGGIQIIMSRPMENYFAPMVYELRSFNKPTIDVLQDMCLGTSSPRTDDIMPDNAHINISTEASTDLSNIY